MHPLATNNKAKYEKVESRLCFIALESRNY